MGLSQSNQAKKPSYHQHQQPSYQQQHHQPSYQQQPRKQINSKKTKDSPMMTDIKSRDLFYYIVPLKNKNNEIIKGYDIMIAVDKDHNIKNTKVLSMVDYNKIAGSDEFKQKFDEINTRMAKKNGGKRNKKQRKIKKGGVVINNNQHQQSCPPCPPCRPQQQQQQQQQQIQYQDNTTFGQSFTSGFGIGLGVMSSVILMDLLLPRFNFFGFGYFDMYGGYGGTSFTEINNYYPDNYDEGYEDGYNDANEENEQEEEITGNEGNEDYADNGYADDG